MMTKTTVASFSKAYADAIISDDLPEGEWQNAMKAANGIRVLKWRGEKMPLEEAAELYAKIPSYNEFEGKMIADLHEAFPSEGIEATPAREGSVCIYLWIPAEVKASVMEYIHNCWTADEMNTVEDGSLRVWWD